MIIRPESRFALVVGIIFAKSTLREMDEKYFTRFIFQGLKSPYDCHCKAVSGIETI
jgi:hypothetical protein